MLILGTEASSVILRQTNKFQKLQIGVTKVPKETV